jgi:uncharacterized membrane protein YphA (DoxX/SURF4 family)
VSVASAAVSIVLAVMLVASAVMKFRRHEQVVTTITGLGVPLSWFPLLGAAEVAGAVGLLVGLAVPPVGIAAAIGVIVYFIGAVITHLRAGDHALVAPLVPGLLAVAALALRIASA